MSSTLLSEHQRHEGGVQAIIHRTLARIETLRSQLEDPKPDGETYESIRGRIKESRLLLRQMQWDSSPSAFQPSDVMSGNNPSGTQEL